MEYFSDKENGPVQRNNSEITIKIWAGLVSCINVLVNKGYFGKHFPEECPDGQGCIGTDAIDFKAVLQAEIPNLDWPLVVEVEDDHSSLSWGRNTVPFIPDYLDIMDLLQFCYKHVAAPVKGGYHDYFNHYHISGFDVDIGREEFLQKVNTIFARNGLAYELLPTGEIIRLLSPELVHMMSSVGSPTEVELRSILARAKAKITHYDVAIRYDAMKELWDFWERLKSIYNPSNKKDSITQLLHAAAESPDFRTILETEAKTLTEIGNTYFIRHTEMKQVKIQENDHIEYLYQRMFSMIHLLLKKFPTLTQ
ncbi:AbiJ-NTD4 domain-containing protein [Pectobacterium versatile]|uniref:AbiJ-NTD4 domain-containing protein n=1 Tax=Pectobacterium versatile TaxID=2488639 RepID=UPI001F41C067|nr:stationary phase or STEss regulating sigma factor [Pectobacterium versatile]